MKEIPVLYNTKLECCGCTACYAICPKNAISMEPDEEGFLRYFFKETSRRRKKSNN